MQLQLASKVCFWPNPAVRPSIAGRQVETPTMAATGCCRPTPDIKRDDEEGATVDWFLRSAKRTNDSSPRHCAHKRRAMFPGLAYTCRRKNYVHAAYVNAALSLLDGKNVGRLESMLYNQGISRNVISRILFSDGPFRNR